MKNVVEIYKKKCEKDLMKVLSGFFSFSCCLNDIPKMNIPINV